MRRTASYAPILSPPSRGAKGRDRFRLSLHANAQLLIWIAVTLTLGGLARAETSCLTPGESGISYSLGLDADRDASGTDVEATFRLRRAPEEAQVALLLFVDGIQILGPDSVRPAPCDETVVWTLRLPRPEGVPLDLHASAHPGGGIPDVVADMDPDQPTERGVIGPAHDADDVNSIAFGPPREPVPGTWSGTAERTEAPLADAYLYDGEPGLPVHLRVLPPGTSRWSFHIWFGETFRRDGTFAITCMVDDAQIDAFDGKPLWFGSLDRGEAAMIPAQTPDLSPGWHQVRCLALDDLFTGEERGVAWPYVIRSTFVYRRP